MRKHTRKEYLSGNGSHINSSAQRVSGINVLDTTAPLSTIPNSKWKSKKIEQTFSLEIVSHLTIFGKVELSRKKVSLLLEQEILRVCSEGFSLLDYFSFEWMVNYLVGSRDIHETMGKKLSTISYCANLILLAYKSNLNLLYEKTPIYSELSNFVEENFGNLLDRKYQGRNSLYQLEKFLSFKIEEVDTIFLSRSRNSIPYSSYCKGYGESGRSVRKQRTRYSDELDRDDSEPIQEDNYPLEEIHNQEDLFYIEQNIRRNLKKT